MTGHDGTDREDELFGDTPLLCKDVADMQAQQSELFLTIGCLPFEGDTSQETRHNPSLSPFCCLIM